MKKHNLSKSPGIFSEKMPLETQLSLLNEGHPAHISYLEEQIKNFVKLDLKRYMVLNGQLHTSSYKDVCDAIDRPTFLEPDINLSVGSAAKELWSLAVDEDIPDDIYEDRRDIYEGVFSLASPFAWRRKEPRKIYHIKD